MEYLEYTQDFYEYSLPDVFLPDAEKTLSDYEDNGFIAEGGNNSDIDSSHTVMFKFHHFNSKR